MKKIIWMLVIAMVLSLVSTAALAQGSYLGYMQVVNCSSWVTLRSYASTSAPTVTRVPLGATVEAYYYNGQFAECYYNGMRGYILTRYLG